MRSLIFILAFALLALPSTALSQADKISELDYNAALAKALDAASSRDRRVLMHETFRTGTQVTGKRTIVSEFAGREADKIEVTEEFDGKVSKSDSVRIGDQFFCREGDKGWKRATRECAKGGKAMAIPDGNYEYFVEPNPDDTAGKLYTRRATFTDSGSPEREAVRLKFIEIKFSTNETGAITRYLETRRGGPIPNGWNSQKVTNYFYEPGSLRISDPTNGN